MNLHINDKIDPHALFSCYDFVCRHLDCVGGERWEELSGYILTDERIPDLCLEYRAQTYAVTALAYQAAVRAAAK